LEVKLITGHHLDCCCLAAVGDPRATPVPVSCIDLQVAEKYGILGSVKIIQRTIATLRDALFLSK
jgi:hypothetical protein